MTYMESFILWFFQNLPTFLMSQPIFTFVCLAVVSIVVDLFRRLIHLM